MYLTCHNCGAGVEAPRLGDSIPCPSCHAAIGKLAQLEQALARWYEPRRWRVDLVEPNIYYLIERLWTANGQGENLYQAIAPKHTNYDVFRHLVTRLIARGVDEGWADIVFPEDVLIEDPVYYLEFRDADQFAAAVEALFPEVDWDERIEVPAHTLPEKP